MNQWWYVHGRIYASFVLNELNKIKYKHLNTIQVVNESSIHCILVKNNFIHSQVQFLLIKKRYTMQYITQILA